MKFILIVDFNRQRTFYRKSCVKVRSLILYFNIYFSVFDRTVNTAISKNWVYEPIILRIPVEIYFLHPSRPAHPASYTMGTGLFPGIKRPGAWRWPLPSSIAEVKERLELCLCSTTGPSWQVVGWILSLSWPIRLSDIEWWDNMWMINWKRSDRGLFNVLSCNLPERTKRSHEKLVCANPACGW